jgi:hypothetical protein
MDESKTTNNPASVEPPTELREWVTPSFEQVALKDALTGDGKTVNRLDATTLSS